MLPQVQSMELFGKKIEYDSNKLYGNFDTQGQYVRIISIDKRLEEIAEERNKDNMINYIYSEIYWLRGNISTNMSVPAIAATIEQTMIQTNDTTLDRAEQEKIYAVQNTIDLYENVAEILKN